MNGPSPRTRTSASPTRPRCCRDLEALRLGKPTDLAIHPRLPDCEASRILQFEFRWDLESSPRQLWPLVTNTDRLDLALGFSPVTYRTRYEPGRGVRTFAEGRKAGMPEVGEEYPYEWVEPRRMGMSARVQLRARSNGSSARSSSCRGPAAAPRSSTRCGSSRAPGRSASGRDGGGRWHAEEPRKSLSADRRHLARPAPARACSRSRSVRGAGPDARARGENVWTG